jgi:DNA-binding NarL/FixJ family response regulator
MQYLSAMQYPSPADERIIRIVVAERTLIHCQLLSEAMKRDRYIRVLGAVYSSRELIRFATSSAADIAVVSSSLEEEATTGFEVIRELRQLQPKMRIITLLESSQRDAVVEAFRAGAKGIFSKTEPLKHLCRCVRCVHQGQIWASSMELAFALDTLARVPEIRIRSNKGINLLSAREIEVLRSVAEGLTNRDIGERLNLSKHTVKNYLLRIFDKLGVSNRTELLFLTLSQCQMPSEGESSQDRLERHRTAAHEGTPEVKFEFDEPYAPEEEGARDPVDAYVRCLLCEKAQARMAEQISRTKKNLANDMTCEQMREAEMRAATA